MSDPADTPVMDQVFAQIKQIIGASTQQRFVMEAPGRILDEETYAFDASSIYSSMEKPQPVIEAEFRLSDDLYDVASLIGGPNGKKLSLQYLDALNSLLPDLGAATDVESDREQLRVWLLGAVSSSVDKTDLQLDANHRPEFTVTTEQFTGNRMGFFQTLSQIYLGLKAQWETAKTELLETAMAGDKGKLTLDDYSRWLANTAPVVEAELAALFADLVVRGYYHEVRTYLGLMDVASPGEALEDAKARMRDSSMSSLDETETIYPVVMQPVDWFKGLSTDYRPVDLLLDPQFLGSSLVTLEDQLDQLLLQRQQLAAAAPGDPTALQQQVDAAQTALDTAQSNQVENFGNAAVAAFKAAVKIVATVEDPAASVLDKLGTKDAATVSSVTTAIKSVDPTVAALDVAADQLALLAGAQKATIEAQQKLLAASRALSDLQASHAAAAAASPLLMGLDAQIAELRSRITTMNLVLSSDGSPTHGVPMASPGAGRWTDVMITANSKALSKSSDIQSSSSDSSWSVDFLIGSASGSNSSAAGTASASLQSAATSVNVAFRATKVTFDRGGWFDPGLFSQTAGMFKYPTSSTVSAGGGAPLDANQLPCILPSYPVAFVIAKDVTIDVTTDTSKSDGYSSYLKNTSASGGGFLCFSANSSTTFGASTETGSSGETTNHFLIRIPGPQILGWVLEYVDADQSRPYTKLAANFPPQPPTPPAPPAPKPDHDHNPLAMMATLDAVPAPVPAPVHVIPAVPVGDALVSGNGVH